MTPDLALQITLIAAAVAVFVSVGVCWLFNRKRREPEIAYPVEEVVRLYGRRPGLTLIEVIVVIAIISVLVTLTAGMGQYMLRQAAIRSTEAILASLDQSTLRYKNDRGIWPHEFDRNGDGLPDNSTQTAVHELTRRKDPNGGIVTPYFEGSAQTLRLTDPYASNRVIYEPTTQGYYQVFGPFQDYGREWYNAGDGSFGWWFDDGIAIDVHGWDRNDVRVRANQYNPFWHSGGPNRGRREGRATNAEYGNSDDIYSNCFAM